MSADQTRTLPGRRTGPLRISHTDPDGTRRYQAAEVRNDVPWKPYRRNAEADAGAVERVCWWRRSLIAAAMVLELAAEQAGE